jgi:hypothetical protein
MKEPKLLGEVDNWSDYRQSQVEAEAQESKNFMPSADLGLPSEKEDNARHADDRRWEVVSNSGEENSQERGEVRHEGQEDV